MVNHSFVDVTMAPFTEMLAKKLTWRLGLQVQREAKTLAQDENRYLDWTKDGAWDVAEGKQVSLIRIALDFWRKGSCRPIV